MKTPLLPAALALLTLTSARSQQDDPQKANLEALAANASAFVEAYNQADADAIAQRFLPDGEIVLANGEVVSGREEISEFYADLFSGDKDPKAALEAGAVRFPTPGIAIEDGTLHVTRPTGEIVSHFYTAVQIKQENGSWLTASIRDEIQDHAPASEKLIALEWMVGDWLLEHDGARTFLSFSWSDDGPYIDGKLLTEQAGEPSTSSTYRIGWNSNRKNYISWAFDSLGGYTKSDWTATEGGWLLRTAGVTADGEVNQSTQLLEPDPEHQGFGWSSRDQTIGGKVLPDRSIRVVKRPPAPVSEIEPESQPGEEDAASEPAAGE
jgi:uncharacterized protein (TIGR02246 family)